MWTKHKYRFGYCNARGGQYWSETFTDFDDCMDAYVRDMQNRVNIGENIALAKWRGVFNLDQAALLVANRNIYEV